MARSIREMLTEYIALEKEMEEWCDKNILPRLEACQTIEVVNAFRLELGESVRSQVDIDEVPLAWTIPFAFRRDAIRQQK